MKLVLWTFLLASAASGAAAAQEEPAAVELASPAAEALARARGQIEARKFRGALEQVEVALAAPGIAPAERREAVRLRLRAHVGLEQLETADADYRELLALAPGEQLEGIELPDPVRERLAAIRAAMVGRVRIVVHPSDAAVLLDGVPLPPDAAAGIPLLAGEHTVSASRDGYDSQETPLVFEGGQDVTLEVQLLPNGRALIVITEEPDVTVELDGQPAGRTVARADAQGAQLEIPGVSLGEHRIVLRAPCRASVDETITVSGDLLEAGPIVLGPFVLQPARARLALEGVRDGWEVRVDGRTIGRAPSGPLDLCPGAVEVAVVSTDRVVWSERIDLGELDDLTVEVRPRPNVVAVDHEQWPEAARAWLSAFNVRDAVADTAPDVDLVVRRLPAGWVLSSPHLAAPEERASLPPAGMPRFLHGWAGARLADSERFGGALVLEVVRGGPAAAAGVRVGERVAGVGQTPVTTTARALELVALLEPRAPASLRLSSAGGTRTVALTVGGRAAALDPLPEDRSITVDAAWAAAAVSLADPAAANAATAMLARLQLDAGASAKAAVTWSRVRPDAAVHVGADVIGYGRARALEAAGDAGAAREAYRVLTALEGASPAVVAAAADRAAALGPAAPPP